MNENVIKVLTGAKKLLEEKGWTQGALSSYHDGYCVVGALSESAAAMNADDRDTAYSAAILALYKATGFYNPIYSTAITLSERAVYTSQYIFEWNDYPERTKDEVLAVFDGAIELARMGGLE